jgi:Transposase IS116/IS110/IS902 family
MRPAHRSGGSLPSRTPALPATHCYWIHPNILGVPDDSAGTRTVPGIGPISATAIAALAPPVETFAKGRDAWLGLTPLQRSTGGKQKLGATSKMSERTLRRLLIIGQRRRATGEQTQCAKGILARTDAGSQTAHAGDRRARQQDGADRLGATCKAGELQRSGRSQGVILAGLRSSEM